MSEKNNARLKNTLVGVKDTKLSLTVDLSTFANRALTPEMLTESGNSYRVAGAGSQWIKLDGAMKGVMVKLDVIVSKKEYETVKAQEAQKAHAVAALAEIQQLNNGKGLATTLGLDADILAQAIAIAQTLNAQAQAKAE